MDNMVMSIMDMLVNMVPTDMDNIEKIEMELLSIFTIPTIYNCYKS